MKTSDKGIAFLVAHEGIVPAPYLDSVRVWTYGIGHTAAAGDPDPSKLTRGLPRDIETALRVVFDLFKSDLAKYEADVNRKLNGRKVKQHEFDAAVSFHYNTGAISRANWVELWLAGKINHAAQSMITNYRRPAGVIPRREAEMDLFQSGDYGRQQAAIWPVDANGKITWKPLRTLSQDQILAYLRPAQAQRPEAKPSLSEKPFGNLTLPSIIAAVIAAAFYFVTKG